MCPINPGDADAITRAYNDSLLIEMRHLDNKLPATTMQLYGRSFATPITTAACSHLDHYGYHDDGMVEMARGAKLADAVNFVGMGTEEELERIVATGAAVIKIIKPYEDNQRILNKIRHAEQVGVMAVGMDIDHSFNGRGEYDMVREDAMRPKTVDEIRMFVQATKLPFIVKGVLSVTDALKCLDAGVQGIVVSHHHGILDYALPPLMVLPEIARAVDGRMPIFVDCGFTNGYDAFKALALGATGVSIGRAMLDSLKQGGAQGVSQWIGKQTQQLRGVMARTGAADLQSIDPAVIRRLG